MIREAIAGTPDVVVDRADLVEPTLATVPDPGVAAVAATLAPPVVTASGLEAEPVIESVEPGVRPGVDVVGLALAEPIFPIRRSDLRLPGPSIRTMPIVESDVRHPVARIAEPAVARANPPALSLVSRTPTPPADVRKDELRAMLLALFRASGAASPRDLQLVGIYRRVPGGAIREIALDGDAVQVRVDPRRRARAATLVVGRTQNGGNLVTVEL